MPKQKKLLKLTDSNYYDLASDLQYFSVSQYKSFMQCEAATMAYLRGEYQRENTTALLVGSYVDAWVEGTIQEFIYEHHDEIYTKQGKLRAEFVKADEIIHKIHGDDLFRKFLSGEKQKIITFKEFGANWKIKMDSYIPEVCIADLKTARDIKGLPKWRYDYQGAIYQRGVEKKTKKKLPFYLAVATKEDIVELGIFQIPQSTLDLALEEVAEAMPHLIEVKAGKIEPTRCEECDYCKRTRKTVVRNYNELLES